MRPLFRVCRIRSHLSIPFAALRLSIPLSGLALLGTTISRHARLIGAAFHAIPLSAPLFHSIPLTAQSFRFQPLSPPATARPLPFRASLLSPPPPTSLRSGCAASASASRHSPSVSAAARQPFTRQARTLYFCYYILMPFQRVYTASGISSRVTGWRRASRSHCLSLIGFRHCQLPPPLPHIAASRVIRCCSILPSAPGAAPYSAISPLRIYQSAIPFYRSGYPSSGQAILSALH